MTDKVVAGVELGGTKAIAVLARGAGIFARETLPTRAPQETLPALRAILDHWRAQGHEPAALGIASFGPICVRPGDPDYGKILTTTKPLWSGADIVGGLAPAIDGPAAFHTDVTAAAFAEGRWGAAKDCRDHVYITIGTGVGGGIIVGGVAVEGQMHPELGHIRIRRQPGDSFSGHCPFHGDCLEGLVSGPAIAARAGRPADALTPDDPLWARVAGDIAEALVTLLVTLAPQRIVIGGGVGVGQPQLLPMIRTAVDGHLAGYLPFGAEAIVAAGLGPEAGPLGAVALALDALRLSE